MDSVNRVKLARYHQRRGLRMLKCARGVESLGHKKAFLELAAHCFEARDYNVGQARIMIGRAV